MVARALDTSGQKMARDVRGMNTLFLLTPIVAAAGEAFMVWLLGDSFGLAVQAFSSDFVPARILKPL